MLTESARRPTTNMRSYVSDLPGSRVTSFFCSVSVHAPPLIAFIAGSLVVIA